MKYIITFISICSILFMSSCYKNNSDGTSTNITYIEDKDKDDLILPIEVKKMLDNNVYDTTYIIQTKEINYVFDKNKDLLLKVKKTNEVVIDGIGSFLLLILITLILIWLIKD